MRRWFYSFLTKHLINTFKISIKRFYNRTPLTTNSVHIAKFNKQTKDGKKIKEIKAILIKTAKKLAKNKE